MSEFMTKDGELLVTQFYLKRPKRKDKGGEEKTEEWLFSTGLLVTDFSDWNK